MKTKLLLRTVLFLFCTITFYSNSIAQDKVLGSKEKGVEVSITDDGFVSKLVFYTEKGKETVGFNEKNYRGPSFGDSISLSKSKTNSFRYEGVESGIKPRKHIFFSECMYFFNREIALKSTAK